jgi:hypothetical protein
MYGKTPTTLTRCNKYIRRRTKTNEKQSEVRAMTTPRAFFVDDACFIFRSGCIVVVGEEERDEGEE